MVWLQNYDPLNNVVLSTVLAGLPVVVLLGALGLFHVQAHRAALLGLITGLIVAIFAFGMPGAMAGKAVGLGLASGLFPIGWIVLNIIFLHRLTTLNGSFKVLQSSISGITEDRRLQLLLVAFSFGAFFEGAAGFGTPVAVTGAILIGLGFSPLAASGLALIANTAPVAYGALGAPIIGLSSVTGLDINLLSAMIGRQLPLFSLLVPFWLIWAFAGFRGMLQIWPAILVAGTSFAIPQFLVSNLHGPWLVDVIAALVSMGCLTLFLKVWQPREMWTSTALHKQHDESHVSAEERAAEQAAGGGPRISVTQAWLPWIILTVFVFTWGIPQFKNFVDHLWAWNFAIPGLDKLVQRVPPVVLKPTLEPAVFKFNVLSMAGTGILFSAIVGGLIMGYSVGQLVKEYWNTLKLVRFSLLTICAMFSIGFLTRYAGLDSTLGLAFAHTGVLYPLFGTMLGWLGVALTGSDTSSNVLFGGLQKTTAEQIGLSPILMAAANSSGGVMGKMIDAQSIVVASTATKWFGHEGDILRFVFFHSVALAVLVGLLVTLQAYVAPFTHMVVH
ncbi:L-lactate permease [Crenobacter sp. SG2303]|uniref:L-lactate permease n=1 Tax=Crenobacter oryzisoli TaxID=3056844 RepID=A0ABT7XP18_9NEIS|nr:L-lactate permease [Crenobacter sp. SG2303]MDN0075428.1 L-lactate permease [Crenobacter sp. SG2303]